MRSLLAAIRFLSILPLPGGERDDEAVLAKSILWFPFVGVLLGAICGGAVWVILHALPLLPSTVLAVAILAGLSGALHLDGLADTADGLLSARPREKMLEIMKDSRIGTMGAVALILVLLLKIAALAELDPAHVWRAAAFAPLAGRAAMVFLLWGQEYARPEGGLGGLFFRAASTLHAGVAALVLFAAGWALLGEAGLAGGIAAMLAALALAIFCHARLGGGTGDTVGAGGELAETTALLAVCGWNAFGGTAV